LALGLASAPLLSDNSQMAIFDAPICRWILLLALSLGGWLASPASAQLLPPHPPLRILIVSDEVNPHGLSPAELTQPGDISAALLAVAGLRFDVTAADPLLEIPTDQIETATALLALPRSDPGAYDVLIYFAHRTPNGADSQARQEAFVAAVDAFLTAGAGVVSFHHGIYRTGGKQSMADLLGAEATGAVIWDTVEGQNVIAVSPEHYLVRYGVNYPFSIAYEDLPNGVPQASYPAFNGIPDERYPTFSFLPAAGEIEILFASDYEAQSHVLGYIERRPQWTGAVVVFQPGEYQPRALVAGNELQILLNAIFWTAAHGTGELLFADGFESGDSGWWTASVDS